MSEIVSFRDLDAWQCAMDLVVTTYKLAASLPPTEQFALSNQMRRAAVSIPSNIAEGQAGGPGKRYLQHVRIALASLAELDTQLELAVRVRLLAPEDVRVIEEQLARTGRLLHGLARGLRRRQRQVMQKA
jgi:four helix bundle protein